MVAVDREVRRGGRPRSEEADRAIITATLDLLAEVGVGSLSIEAVAARAGVGKATVYRRWPNKDALIVDAMAALKGPVPTPQGGPLREELVNLLYDEQRGREAARRRRLYTCFAGEIHRHPDLARLFAETVIEPRREVLRGVIRAAVGRGELRDDLAIDDMVHIVTAPILHWSTQRPDKPLDRDRMRVFLDAVLTGLAPR